MSEQSYASHTHRPVPTAIAGCFTLVALVSIVGAWTAGWNARDLAMVSLTLAVVMLVAISRRYTIALQDRIILLEMKVRGAELLTPEQEGRLAQLPRKHVVALRFASDAELPELLERTVSQSLSPDQIKREIKRWRADLLRT